MWEREDYVSGREEGTGMCHGVIVLMIAWSGDYVSSIFDVAKGTDDQSEELRSHSFW